MNTYTLKNKSFTRVIEYGSNGIRTISLQDDDNLEYIKTPCHEFAFSIDDERISSYSTTIIREVDGNKEENVNVLVVKEVEEFANGVNFYLELPKKLAIKVTYLLLEDKPALRKYLEFTNLTSEDIKLTNLIFDDTAIAPGSFADCDLYAGTKDVKQSVCFTIEGSEDIIRCHNPYLDKGWIMGSSAPGLLRYYLVYPNWNNVVNGCNMSSAPFAKYLKSNEAWQSPASLLALYKGKLEDSLTNENFRSLVRENLPSIPEEGIMYCTWLPFLKNINEELCMNLATKAANFNFKYFVLDDGWFDENDRRNVDPNKFPNGLAPLAKKVQSLGMTFGLWLNIGTDYGLNGLVPKEWYSINSNQKVNRLGFNYETGRNVFCLASDYRQYVIDTLNELVANLGVGYFKLDFSNVMSPYGILPWGCHCKNHKYHKGFEDSFIGFYEGMKAIRDGVLAKYPNVIVDFSFETFGTERPNIAALEYSALHHATNSSANNVNVQKIDRVRRNFYDWLEKLPPERILNGLLSIQGNNAAEYLLSSFAGAPLVAGDLLKITEENAQRIKLFTSKFQQLSSKGAMTEFYLLENSLDFDGFIRYSKDGHGFVALFNRKNTSVSVTLPKFAQNAIDVETNQITNVVKANSCAMLVF